MVKPLGKYGVLLCLALLAACSPIATSKKTISISGAIEVPLPVHSEVYWIDSGPLFIASRDPLITYRVVDKEELKFAGTEQSVYEFFSSSLSDPDGIVEESFRDSHDSYDLRKQRNNGMDVYILSKPDESKAYIVSRSLPIGLEIQATGTTASELVEEIVNSARLLVKGD